VGSVAHKNTSRRRANGGDASAAFRARATATRYVRTQVTHYTTTTAAAAHLKRARQQTRLVECATRRDRALPLPIEIDGL
jgi:hypothetical protein